MKIYIVILLFVATPYFPQDDFEGQIIYTIKVVPKGAAFDETDSTNYYLGDSLVYLIKDGYYSSKYYLNGKMSHSYTYLNDNKLYDSSPNKPYITFRNTRKGNSERKNYSVEEDSLIVIEDYSCFLVRKTGQRFAKSFYSNNLRIRYDSFLDHNLGGWSDELLMLEGRLPLKSVTEYDEYFTVREAVSVEKRKVSNNEFEIESGKLIVASSSALDIEPKLNPLSDQQIACYQIKNKMAGDLLNLNGSIGLKVRFVLSEQGEILYPEIIGGMNRELGRFAIDVIKECDLTYTLGKVDGNEVASEVFLPIEFRF